MSDDVKQQAAALLAAMPVDNRDKTGRICGDPIFERSALFQKLKAEHTTPIRGQS